MAQRGKRVLYWLWKVLPIPRWGQWVILWFGNTKFLVGVMAVVFDEAGRVLVLEHTYRNRYPWGLPGGWLGGGERLETALARELAEETGLDITVGEVFYAQSSRRRPHLDICFLCRYHGGTFRPDAEIAAMRFCAPDNLPPDMLPSQQRIVARAVALRQESKSITGNVVA